MNGNLFIGRPVKDSGGWMGFDEMINRMFEILRDLNTYKIDLLGMVISWVITGVLLVPVLVGITLVPTSPQIGLSVAAIFAVIDLVVSIFVSQIPIAGIIRVSETRKFDIGDALSHAWGKILKMGLAGILVFIILLVVLGLFSLPLIIGAIGKNPVLALLGVLLLFLGLLVLLVIAYFLWLVPVLAYKKGTVIASIRESIKRMKNAGFAGAGVFLLVIGILFVLGLIFDILQQLPLILAVTGNPAGVFIYLAIIFVFQAIELPIIVSSQVAVYEGTEKTEKKAKGASRGKASRRKGVRRKKKKIAK